MQNPIQDKPLDLLHSICLHLGNSLPQSERLTSDDLLLIIHLKLTLAVNLLPVPAESSK